MFCFYFIHFSIASSPILFYHPQLTSFSSQSCFRSLFSLSFRFRFHSFRFRFFFHSDSDSFHSFHLDSSVYFLIFISFHSRFSFRSRLTFALVVTAEPLCTLLRAITITLPLSSFGSASSLRAINFTAVLQCARTLQAFCYSRLLRVMRRVVSSSERFSPILAFVVGVSVSPILVFVVGVSVFSVSLPSSSPCAFTASPDNSSALLD